MLEVLKKFIKSIFLFFFIGIACGIGFICGSIFMLYNSPWLLIKTIKKIYKKILEDNETGVILRNFEKILRGNNYSEYLNSFFSN